MNVGQIARELGGKKTLGRTIRSQSQFIELVNQGFPFDSLSHFSQRIDMSVGEIAGVLRINPRTLARRKRAGQLMAAESDRLARLAKIMAYAVEVLGNLERASRWMRKPNRALGMLKPIERLDTDLGSDEVEELLGRIDHGIYS